MFQAERDWAMSAEITQDADACVITEMTSPLRCPICKEDGDFEDISGFQTCMNCGPSGFDN